MSSFLETLNPSLGGVWQTYALALLGVLATAGALLLFLDRGLGKDVGAVWRTYRGWWLMVPLVLGAVVLGRVAVILGVALLALSGFKELARATGLYRDWWMSGGVYAGIVATAVLSLMFDPRTGNPGWYGLFMALPVFVVVLLLVIPIVRHRARGQLQTVALAILGFVYFGWMFAHLGFLANAQHAHGYLLFLVFGVVCTDVAAFTFGKIFGGKVFGRRRLCPRISPNKTWEGALGAALVALALPWTLRFSFPHFGALQLLLSGLIIGLGAQLGDLTISFIKRDLGIKDMGAAIPGHGGVLDRIDSLIFTAPLFFHMVRWFHDLY